MNLETIFALREHGTRPRTELIAGVTTFMTMAYILVVNPTVLAETGMDKGALFTATALSAALATLVMALYANLPFALAPGMGLNTFFAYTVCLSMGFSWQLALTAVFIEGILFLILTFLNVREAIIGCIPLNLKKAISAGIGLFIAFIGLSNAGIVVHSAGTLPELGAMATAEPLIALLGLLAAAWLLTRGVQGALLWGILLAAAAGLPLGVTELPAGWHGPPSLEPIWLKFQWSELFSFDLLVVLLTFLFVDLFDTAGTLIGVATKANLFDADGHIYRARQALVTDALGTACGACLGTSTVTVYVESSAGIAAGGRTGLTALTCAVLFLAALFLAPLFLMIPPAATAPALILVGLMMVSPIGELDLTDWTESVPAFLTMILMPASGSIANGIMFGVLAYVLLKLLSGQRRIVSPVLYGVAVFFLLKFLV